MNKFAASELHKTFHIPANGLPDCFCSLLSKGARFFHCSGYFQHAILTNFNATLWQIFQKVAGPVQLYLPRGPRFKWRELHEKRLEFI